MTDAERVLDYWFGTSPCDAQAFATRMRLWFEADSEQDAEIEARFAELIHAAARGELEGWNASARGNLALIILLDQMPRNVHRGTSRAFMTDAQARALCRAGLQRGDAAELTWLERQFYYLPLQHSECLEDQQESVELFSALAREPGPTWVTTALQHALQVAQMHEQIIRRYGRFPHRNDILGRESTFQERLYIAAGGPTYGQPVRHAPLEPKRFQFLAPSLELTQTVCVDGIAQGMRCLSHWPGVACAPELRHELSTGMALAHARLSAAERVRLLGPFSVVTNDHYDTDGVLSAFALLQPEQALEHESLLLAAAGAGDFRTFAGTEALALDLTVSALMGSARSPIATQLDYARHAQACYCWLLTRLPELLREPFSMKQLWGDRFTRIMDDLAAVERAQEVEVERYVHHDLAVVISRRQLTRQGLVHAARAQYRVLHVVPASDGYRYRFFYRNESWFACARERVPPRATLGTACALLSQLEAARTGRWWCTAIDQTSPQLGFGAPERASDVFGDPCTQLDPPSRLDPQRVIDALLAKLPAIRTDAPAAALAASENL